MGLGSELGSGRDSFAPRPGWQRPAREVQMDSAGARLPAKPPFARLNRGWLNAARGLILLRGESWCRTADPALVMPEFNVTRVRTRPHRGGCAFKIDLSQSRCPQCAGTCVPTAWPQLWLRGTGDKGLRLPVPAASAGFPSMGSSKLGAQRVHASLWGSWWLWGHPAPSCTAASAASLPPASPGAVGLCHVLGRGWQGPSPAWRISAHHPPDTHSRR